MRARRWKREEGDSLDLLLDTMCNLFGGIIFVALLVALLAGEDASQKVNPGKNPSQDLLEREIANLQQDLDALKRSVEEAGKMAENAKGAAAEQQAFAALKAEVQALRTALELANQEAPEGQDLGQYLQQTKDKKAVLERETLDLGNKQKSLREEKERLQKRLADLQKRGEEIAEQKTEGFRFPREKASAKNPYWILLSEKRFYPVRNPNENFSYWTEFVRVQKTLDEEKVQPIPGRGLKNEKEIREVFSGIKASDFYPVFIISPDSFSEFRKARDIALAMGFEFGVNFHEMGEPLVLVTEGGTRPGVQ